MKQQFWRFIFGTFERDVPVDVELLPDRMILSWGMWFWKARKEVPWAELTMVPAASVWLGDHPNWDRYGITLRWDTATEPHRGWKPIWLPCAPGDAFYLEIRRLIESFHPALEPGFNPSPPPPKRGWLRPG